MGVRPASGAWLQVGFGADSEPPTEITISDPQAGWHATVSVETEPGGFANALVDVPQPPKMASEVTVCWAVAGKLVCQSFQWPGGEFVQVRLESGIQAKPAKSTNRQSALPELRIAPNPFNPLTTVHFSLPQADRLRLELTDILGRSVSTLADGRFGPGEHQFTVDGSAWPSGTYFLTYHLSSGPSGVRRLLLLK